MIENPLPEEQVTTGPCIDIVRGGGSGNFRTKVPGHYVVYKNGEKIFEGHFEEDDIVYEFSSVESGMNHYQIFKT